MKHGRVAEKKIENPRAPRTQFIHSIALFPTSATAATVPVPHRALSMWKLNVTRKIYYIFPSVCVRFLLLYLSLQQPILSTTFFKFDISMVARSIYI